MNRNGLHVLMIIMLMGALKAISPCFEASAYAEESKTTYRYYVDSETGKPYSPLYESGPVRYVVQFPGHDPYDAFLYGRDFVAFLSITSEESYAIRNLWFSLRIDGKELIPARNNYLSDKEQWKQYTVIRQMPKPAAALDLDSKKQTLIGFIYEPEQLRDSPKAELEVKFDLTVGKAKSTIEKHFVLRRTTTSEQTRGDPRLNERKPGEAVLVGAWWLDTHGSKLPARYQATVAKVESGKESAVRLTGRGFLPRVRYDRIHFEGFFVHFDRDRSVSWKDLSHQSAAAHREGRLDEAISLGEAAIQRAEGEVDPDDLEFALLLHNVGMLNAFAHKYERAEALLRRSLAIRERQLGTKHLDVAITLQNLGAVLSLQGKGEAAEPLQKRSLEIFESQLGSDHPETAKALDHLAHAYILQKKYSAAQATFEKALAIREHALGAHHPDTGVTYDNLGWVCAAQGAYERAEKLHRKALEILEMTYGPDHPEVGRALMNLSHVYEKMGKAEQARAMRDRAAAIRSRHPIESGSSEPLFPEPKP
jgi:tetratricopeptide (TPR) repeat protein